MSPSVRIVCETSWVTGRLAQSIAQHNQDLEVEIVDARSDPPAREHRPVHLMLWGGWRPDMGQDFLLSIHHLDSDHSGYDLFKAYEVARRARMIAVPGTEAFSFLVNHFGIEPRKIRVVPYGIDHRKFSPGPSTKGDFGIPEEKLVVGHVSSFHPRKGTKDLLDAFELLKDAFPQFHLLLFTGKNDLGSEQVRQRLDSRIEKLGDAVTMVVDSPLPYDRCQEEQWVARYRAMDLYCSPARIEGGPIPALEAMACGVPLVLTDTGMADQLAREGAAILTNPQDPRGIASGLLQASERREELRELGLKAVTEFTEEDFAHNYRKLYEDCFGERSEVLSESYTHTTVTAAEKKKGESTDSKKRYSLPGVIPSDPQLMTPGFKWNSANPLKRILVVRAGSDETTTAVLERLKELCPESTLTLLTDNGNSKTWPESVEIVTYCASKLLPETFGIRRTHDLARKGYDLVLTVTQYLRDNEFRDSTEYGDVRRFLNHFDPTARLLIREDFVLESADGLPRFD